jgi:hypothetical protein
MDEMVLKAAVELSEATEEIFIATADDKGQPHVGVARRLELAGEGRVAVAEWFCPGTLTNVQKRPQMSLVVWDREADAGYQLLGAVEEIKDVAMMDGYEAKADRRHPMPQVERRMVIRVERVFDFTRAPHTDMEE